MHMDTSATDSLIQFPCDFPIKIMGKKTDTFIDIVTLIVQKYVPDFDVASIEVRSSKAGNYLALTCNINATSQQQLDDIYRALSGHPAVSVVL